MPRPAYYALLDELAGLLHESTGVEQATDLITGFADRTLQTHVKATLDEFGEPPTPWALALFGSEGRREQTLLTDQDNALILSDDALGKPEILNWFERFGASLNDKLHASGYRYCNGGIMAGNPKWCVPLQTWKQYFRKWVRQPDPMAVMQSTIFFDLRHGAGDQQLTDSLQSYLLDLLSEKQDVFFYHMVQNALKVQVPPATLRRIWLWMYPEPDLKHLSLPVVGAARIMALRNGLQEQHTGQRLRLLAESGKLQSEKASILLQTIQELTRFRLIAQLEAIRRDTIPGNTLPYRHLSQADQVLFRNTLDGVLLARTMLRNAIGAYF